MQRILACLVAALASAIALPAAGAERDIAALIERAERLGLAERPTWHRLMHYLPDGGGVLSEVDSANFFLAANGRRDPAAELAATLRAFARPAGSTLGPRDEHPQCRFIGRFHWLAQQLEPAAGTFPDVTCRQFQRWREAIAPHRAALVFPAAYLNNPSSMFGHTLLRIDPPPGSQRGELTAYAINFAAQTDESNGALFAIKGLTGLYPGQYSLRKYYELVNDYSEIESRDIWSYPLDLEPDEIDRMLRHLWEMEDVRFDYYFLSENCSYQLLRLIEVARPDLDLHSGFFYQVEPSATVKRLDEAGLLGEPSFRPALVTRIRGRLERLPPAGRDYVAELVSGTAGDPPPGLDERGHAIALEIAFDLLKHRQAEGEIDSDTYGERAMPILRRRSRLPPGRVEPGPAPDTAPHRAHDATRASLGVGNDELGDFVELGLRASFHELTEREPGFTRGAQIEVLDTRVRVPTDGGDADLETLIVADILSLARRGRLIRPLSWRFRGGYRHVWLDEARREGSIVLEGGLGPAWYLGDTLTGYALGQVQVLADRALPKGASAGAGLRLGAVWRPSNAVGLHAWAEAHEHPARIDATLVEAAIEQTWALSRNRALHLRLEAHGRPDGLSGAGTLGLRLYY